MDLTGIGAIIQLVLWILGFVMERSRLTLQQKESYYRFVESMAEVGLAPAKHKTIAKLQLEQLAKLREQK